jgi:ligand-binding sensor domain-containing protein
LVHFANGRFTEWTEDDGRPRGIMNALFVDSTGAVWVTSEVGGAAQFSNGRFDHFAGLDTGWTGGIVVDGRGNAWLQRAAGLWEKRVGAPQFAPAALGAAGLRPHGPILVDHQGDVWFDGDREAMTLHGGQLFQAPIAAQIMVEDGAHGMWAAIHRAIWHRDSLGQTTVIPLTDDAGASQIHSLLVDREGTVWVGTSTSGLLRIRPRVFRMMMSEDGLANEQVAAVMRDRTGRLWVGSSCAATTIIAGDLKTATGNPGCVFSLAQAADGSIWAGSFGGLTRVLSDGNREKIPLDSLPNTTPLAMYADPDTSMWIGTANGLVHEVHGQYRRYGKADGLPSTEIHYITRDHQGALWIGTVGGLARLDGDRFHAWTKADGLPHNYVRAIYQDTAGVWWIGTYGGGLARFDGQHFIAVTAADGLFDNVVSAILEDASGNLWMSGNRGIFRASRQSLNDFANGSAPKVTSVGYGPSDGLLTTETNGGFSRRRGKTTTGGSGLQRCAGSPWSIPRMPCPF